MVIEVIGIGGAALAASAYWWRKRLGFSTCPQCKKRSVLKQMVDTDEISSCTLCNWQRYKHGKPVPEPTRSCPRCSGDIAVDMSPTREGLIWRCLGYPDRASIVAQRGEAMTPKSLRSIPSCKWTGKDSDYGTVWR